MRDYLEESGGATDYLFDDQSPDDSEKNEESSEQSTTETDNPKREVRKLFDGLGVNEVTLTQEETLEGDQ